MKEEPRKHHYVPECYLKAFKKFDALYVLNLRKVQKGYNASPQPRQPGGICYGDHYYKIDPETNLGSLRMEDYDELFVEKKVLKELEGKYPGLLHRIIKDNKLSLEEAVEFSDFIIQLKLRNPYWFREQFTEHLADWIDSAVENTLYPNFLSDPRFKHLPPERIKMILENVREDNKNDPNFAKNMFLFSLIQRNMGDSENNNKHRKSIIDSSWTLIKAPSQGPYFITSDNPGYALDFHSNHVYNTRFTSGFVFTIPLSYEYCLVISDEDTDRCFTEKHPYKEIPTVQIDKSEVNIINNYTILLINELLIGADTLYLSEIARLNNPKRNKV